jgi:hypothetical protein
MDNINDRYNLILLLHKENKSIFDKCHIRKLSNKYPDNKSYEDILITELSNSGLMEFKNSEAKQDPNGNWVDLYPDLPKYRQTTQQGEIALKGGLFPSESAQKKVDKCLRCIQIYGIPIAALGGLITILSFLYKYIKGF